MITYQPPQAVDRVPVIDLTGSFSDVPQMRRSVALYAG